MALTRVARSVVVAGLLSGVTPHIASAQTPVDAYYQFLIGRHLEGAGDNAGALAAFESAAAADPTSAEVRAEIASFHMRRNQRPEAEKNAKAALALDATNVEANRVLGLIAATNAENERNTREQTAAFVRESIGHLEKAVAGVGGQADAQLNFTLGRLYLVSGDLDKAVLALGRVLNQNPGSVQARLTMAQAQADNRDLPGAINTLEEIVEDEPRVASALGQYQQQAGMLKEAAETYTRALQVQPTSRELKQRRIAVLFAAKDYQQAAAFAADAQKQHPDDSRFPRLRATALWEAGDRTMAIALLEATVKQFPRDATAQLALVDLYGNAGRDTDAERVLRQMLVNDPNNPDALNFLGYMLANNNERLDEAIDLVQRALKSEPDNGAYLDSLGWAHFRKGNLADAEKYLTAAAARMPTNAEVLDHLGDLHARRSRWSEAIDAWTRALQGDGVESLDRAAIEKKLQDARRRAR